MEKVNLTINGKTMSVPAGSTILEAASANGIRIPTLCFLKELDVKARCGMCVVEVEGAKSLQYACAVKVREGMAVRTDTDTVRASRKQTLEKLLSRHEVDCHHCLRIGSSKCDDLDPKLCEMCFFCDCVKDGFCDLQALAREYKVDFLALENELRLQPQDTTTAIVRNPNKCVLCRRCVDVCGKVQTVHNLVTSGRGSEMTIAPAGGKSMAESGCIGCGRCVEVCPTGALFAMEHKDELVYYAHKYGVKTAAMVDAGVIPELERVLKLKPGTVAIEQLAGALKKIGIDDVYDADDVKRIVAAEAEKLLDERLKEKKPVILTDSFAARAFLEENFPALKEHFLFLDSPIAYFGAEMRGAYEKLFALTPIGGDAVETEKTHAVDITVNPRELSRIMVRTGAEPNPKRTADLKKLQAPAFHGTYGRLLEHAEWNMEREPEVFDVDGQHCAVCHNLGQARRVLDAPEGFDIIRVIA